MCVKFAFYHQFGINTWRSKFEQKTDGILLSIDPRDKEHKDPDVIDLSVPRRAQYLHKAWKRHQNTVYWVDINLAIDKKFPAYCIPKVVGMETGEVIYENVCMSPRPPPKISLKHEWKKELGSEHAQRPEVGQLSWSFQWNKPIPNPSRERPVRPVLKITREPCKMEEKRPVLRRPKLILLTKKLFLRKERRNPLLKQTQKMCQTVVKHVLVTKANYSTLEIKHFVKEL